MRIYVVAFLLVLAIYVADACEVAEDDEDFVDKRFLKDTFEDFKDFVNKFSHKAEDAAKKLLHKVEDIAKKVGNTAQKTAKKVLSSVDVLNILDKAVDYIDSTVSVLGCSKIAEEVKDAVDKGGNKGNDDSQFTDICRTALGLLEKIAKKGVDVLKEHAS